MAQVELPVVVHPEVTVRHEIQGLAVRPGDTLVLCCKSLPDGFAAQIERHLPGVVVVAVEAEAMAVYRPEGA